MNNQFEIIMIQPKTSLTGSVIKMLPIGLLYASYKVVKSGFTVHIFDARIKPHRWEKDLRELINAKTLIVGLTVMSGVSVEESIKISRYIKTKWPSIKVVWGGPHPTFSPNDVLSENSVDYSISGYGSESFFELVCNIAVIQDAPDLKKINGLSWKDKGKIITNTQSFDFEFLYYKDIPYHLIKNFSDYKYVDTNERIFPMYSVMGCPYKCTFCSSPAQYASLKKKWMPYSVSDVIEHIKMVKEEHGATFIYFIDDDSFVDLKHVENIIDEINRLKIKIKLGFRGARINEVAKMSDDFIKKIADAGTNNMHIGIESGSDRILSLIKKNTTTKQILEVNRKLARHKNIKVFYNFIVGFPTETIEETKMTRDLILRLIEENPSCFVIPLNKPRPLPNTELFDLAVNYGYKPPKTLKDWGKYDVESSDYNPVWLSDAHNKFIRMMFLCMYFIDDKIIRISEGNSLRFIFMRILSFFYKPIAVFRFKRGFYRFLLEDKAYSFLKSIV
ncbi:MAG: radical SAM protein [Candidatus Omnitrophota bacterium]